MANKRELGILGFCLGFRTGVTRSDFRDRTSHSQQPLGDSGCLLPRSRAEAWLWRRGEAV